MLKTARFHLRPMTSADIAQIVTIEAESFPTTWPRTAYRRELANKLANYTVIVDSDHPPVEPVSTRRHPLLNLLRRRQPDEPQTIDYIVGYVGVWNMADEVHIVAIAIRQAYRGRGLGELLLADLVETSLSSQKEIITLEVRQSNLPAQALYEKFRFLKVGVRVRYYSDNQEDAVIMSTPPIQADSFRGHIEYLRKAREQHYSEPQASSEKTSS